MPDESDHNLIAYLDGELDPRAMRAMEKRLAADSQLRARADAIRKTWDLLDFLPKPDPSLTFTTRTLDKVAILRPTNDGETLASAPAAPVRSTRWLAAAVTAFAAAAAAVFLFAFLLSAPLGRKKPSPTISDDERIAQDFRLLDNLNVYQYGDDLNFVLGLDQPDLFGDDATAR